MEIDPDISTEEYRERILSPMRSVMPVDVMKVLEEQFNSPCTTEIASIDRFVDFMVAEKEGNGEAYDVVIFDCDTVSTAFSDGTGLGRGTLLDRCGCSTVDIHAFSG